MLRLVHVGSVHDGRQTVSDRPSLCWDDEGTVREMFFGWLDGEATAALFAVPEGGGEPVIVMVPRSVMEAALSQPEWNDEDCWSEVAGLN